MLLSWCWVFHWYVVHAHSTETSKEITRVDRCTFSRESSWTFHYGHAGTFCSVTYINVENEACSKIYTQDNSDRQVVWCTTGQTFGKLHAIWITTICIPSNKWNGNSMWAKINQYCIWNKCIHVKTPPPPPPPRKKDLISMNMPVGNDNLPNCCWWNASK